VFDIYTRPDCVWCNKAKELLFKEGIEYNDYDINQKLLREELKSKAPGIKTIPQIFKSGVRIGGYQDLVTYLEEKTNVRISM
jgi:glutaredoxin 3|tara:strand:+ start:3531 stop:3776 length:246 start_codon:yes stop_codon:yes gene_type:complete